MQQAVEHSADCSNAVRNSKLTHYPRFTGRIVVYGETGQSGVGVNYSLLVAQRFAVERRRHFPFEQEREAPPAAATGASVLGTRCREAVLLLLAQRSYRFEARGPKGGDGRRRC